MPRPWHPTHGACHALAMLPLPLRHPACPQGPCCLRPGACQRAHACTPRPWLLHARPGLGCCVLAQALDAACSPKPCLLSAHGGLPWPWLLHAHALAACPWGAAAGLGCCMPLPWLPAHGGLPWPWLLHAHALAACPWGLPWPWLLHALGRQWASQGHARVHATPHRPASSRTPAKLARAFFHFCVPKFIP